MTSRKQLPRPARIIIAVVSVAVMIFIGLMMLVLATMSSPANTDPVTGEPTDMGVVRAGIGMLLLISLPWYRRAPLVVMAAGAVQVLVLQLDPFLLAVGLTVWIVRCSKRWQWVVAAAGLVLIMVSAAFLLLGLNRWPDEEYQSTGRLIVIFGTMLCLGLVLGISLWVRQRRSIEQAEAQAEYAQHSSEQLSDELTRQREREDLAREVHDTLAGRLSGLSLQVGSLEASAQQSEKSELDDALRTTRSYADQALADLRVLLTSLREGGAASAAPAKAPAGAGDLQDILDDATAAGLDVRAYILLDGYGSAPPALQRAVLRISQEALTNALRHSTDRVVQVSIVGDAQRGVKLGFNNASNSESSFTSGSRTGLIGLRERAEMLGGTVEVHHGEAASGEHQFSLTVYLPWPTGETGS